MKSISSTNKLLSSRELAILQKLYRSREFKDKRTATSLTPMTTTFLVYGSINTLSSSQRRIFRNYVGKVNHFANRNIKLTLFSSTVAQYIRGFSSLQKLDSLLKGTTYQRVITVTNHTENESYSQFFAFFTYLKAIKFGDDNTFNFMPSLVFTLSKEQNMLTPRRFNFRQKIITSDIRTKGVIINNLIHSIQSSYNKII
jgi:hypothetical protein